MKQTSEFSRYTEMGMAALLPGMQHLIDRMQAELDDMRLQLAALQGGTAKPARRAKSALPAQPPKSAGSAGMASYWARMTVEERSVEMKRRLALGMKRQKAEARKSKRVPQVKPLPRAKPDGAAEAQV